MNVISLLLKDLQVEPGLDEEFQFPLGISGDIDKYLDKMDKKQLFADYKHDPLFEFLDTSYARKYLTYVTFTAAISLAILAGYEFTQVLTKDTHYGKWTSVVTIVMGIVAVTGPLLHYFYKKHKVLEHGDIDFLLRSKVDQEGKSSETEQQFSIGLRREGPRDHGVILVIDDKKSLKEVGGSGVTATINDGEELRRATLSDEISGEGKYKIVKYCNHTESEYILEMPKESREAQKELGIEKKASYVILVINSKKQLLRKVTLMDCLYGRVKLTDLPKVKLIKREQKRYVNKSMGLTTMLTEKILESKKLKKNTLVRIRD